MLLVSKGFFPSREKAKAALMEGRIYIGGRMYDKPGMSVDVDSEITVKGDSCPFVSRGGMKLYKAIQEFNLDLAGATAMDIGASTGGFTDCMLQNGAKKVYAVDVGYGQLDWKLRNDPRVINMEKINVRYMDTEQVSDRMDFISIDVSFISLRLIYPVAVRLLKDSGEMVSLIKPQFEAGREQVGKKGIVKDRTVHLEVIQNIAGYAMENGLLPTNLTFSPMTGAKGNIEYLVKLVKKEDQEFDYDKFSERAEEVISEAHGKLMK